MCRTKEARGRGNQPSSDCGSTGKLMANLGLALNSNEPGRWTNLVLALALRQCQDKPGGSSHSAFLSGAGVPLREYVSEARSRRMRSSNRTKIPKTMNRMAMFQM